MKYLAILLLIVSGCTSSTPHGKCVGLNGKEDPKLEYEYSTRNILVGLFCVELLFPPVVVLLKELKCPVGPKQ